MNKAFSLFLMVALILGGSLGGAFAGGVALGKTQGEAPGEARSAGNFSQEPGDRSGGDRTQRRGQGGGSGDGFQRGEGAGPGGGGQQRFGQRAPESQEPRREGAERQGFDGGFRGGPGEDAGAGRRGGRGVGGAIESMEGNTLTVTTPRGPVTVTTGDDTAVRKIVDGSLEDLEMGAQIRVTGQRDEDGIVKATSITLIPEGAQEFFGRPGPSQER